MQQTINDLFGQSHTITPTHAENGGWKAKQVMRDCPAAREDYNVLVLLTWARFDGFYDLIAALAATPDPTVREEILIDFARRATACETITRERRTR